VALLYGWRYGFLGIGLNAIVCGIISFVLYKQPPENVNPEPPAEAPVKPVMPAKTKSPAREVFGSRDFWLVALGSLCLCIVEFAATAYFVLYMKDDLLFSVVVAGFLLAVVNGGGGFGKPIVGLISDRLFHGGRRNVLLLMCLVSFVACLIFAFMGSSAALWLLIPIALIFGFAAVGWAGLTLALIGEFAGKEVVGIAAALSAVFGTVGNMIGPPAFGYIIDSTGSYSIAWGFLATMALLAGIFTLFVRENRRRI
jgi:ACS family hexuronate transporter-like MFS transporter